MTSPETIKNAIDWNNRGIEYFKRQMLEVNPFDIEKKNEFHRNIARYMENVKKLYKLSDLVAWSQFRNGV